MNNAERIANPRRFLADGNGGAYARVMSAAIRAAMSDRSASAFRAAIREDRAEHLFANLASTAPTARA